LIRLLVVDDHAGVRAGLGELLSRQPDMTVVGECADGSEVVPAFHRLQPDVVLMDLIMPLVDGVTATRLLLEYEPDACVVILTARVPAPRHAQVRVGAKGFVLKSDAPEVLFRCIRSVEVGCTCCLESVSV
jgi:DNA-binding NarL/FixJ family response regulator